MTYGEWNVEINDNHATTFKNVWIYMRRPDGSDDILQSDGVTIKNIKHGAPMEPTMKLSPETLEAFFNALSRKGFTPPKASHTEGKLEATERHLKDMRKLVFKSNL